MKRFFIPLAALFSLVAPELTRAAPPIYPGVVPYEQLDTRNFYLGNYPILRIMPFMPKDTPPYLPVDTWSFAVNTNLWTLYAYDPPNTTWHQVLGLGGITVTVNPTDTYIPYRANATTFLDSPWNVVTTNKLGFYGPVSFLVYSNLSVGLGMNALVDNTGSQNVAIGDQALQLNTTGNGNVAIGNGALYAADTSYAIGIGVNALNAGSGSANIAIGHGSMATSPTAAYSVAIGEDSMEAATASYNTAVGHESGKTLGAGQYNTILGEASGGVTDGNANVVVGSSIGNVGATHEAKRSVVIGAGNANTTTNLVNSVIVGTAGDGASPRIATSSANLTNVIAIGYDIGITNSNQIVIGNSTNNRLNVPNMVYVDYSTKNTALGYGSQLGGGGGQNTSVGYQALPLAGNQNNDAFGNYALFSSTPSSDSSTALGGYSLYSLTNGTGNVAVGYDSQYYLTNGVYNTAIGFRSLEPNRDGNYNVSVGATTLFNEKHGGENVAVGYNALRNQNGQGGNTALGAFAGQNVAAQTNVIVIGHGSTVTNDNDIVIGNSTNSRVIIPITSWGGTGSKVLTDNGTYQTASSVITGAISSQLLWTNSPTGGGTMDAGSSNVIASLPTGLDGATLLTTEDVFAVGEYAGQNMVSSQSTNIYNIGRFSGQNMITTNGWFILNLGEEAGLDSLVLDSTDIFNFGLDPGESSVITNGSWMVINIGEVSGKDMTLDATSDVFNYGLGAGVGMSAASSLAVFNLGWTTGESMELSNSVAIFNIGDWAGRNGVSVLQNAQDIFNYGHDAGAYQNPQNSTNLFNYGLSAGGAQFVQTVNNYYNYGTDSGYMGVGLASNSEELYNYGAWAGASLAVAVDDGTFVNFTNVYNYGPEAGMQIKGTNATYVLNYGYRAGEQSTMTGVSDLYNYGSDSGYQATYDTSATDIYNYGTSAGKGASYTNSFFILNSGNSAGQSMVAQDSSSILNLGSYAGANMVATNSTDLVNIGSYAGNLSALTNSTHVYTWGYQAGRLLAGDGYTNIYLLGDNAQPTRKTNEFVFGSANDLVTIPGTPRSPQFQDIENVKYWGAIGNTTADDSAAIQACINNTTNGGTVYFPYGFYKVNSPILITNRLNLKLRGDYGKLCSMIEGNFTGSPIFNMNGSQNVTVQDLAFVGVGGNTPLCAILSGRSTNENSAGGNSFIRLEITGPYQVAGIYAAASEVNLYQSCTFVDYASAVPYAMLYLAKNRTNIYGIDLSSFNVNTNGSGGNGLNHISDCGFIFYASADSCRSIIAQYTQGIEIENSTTYSQTATNQILFLESANGINISTLRQEFLGVQPSGLEFNTLGAGGNFQQISVRASSICPVYGPSVSLGGVVFENNIWGCTNATPTVFQVDGLYDANINETELATYAGRQCITGAYTVTSGYRNSFRGISLNRLSGAHYSSLPVLTPWDFTFLRAGATAMATNAIGTMTITTIDDTNTVSTLPLIVRRRTSGVAPANLESGIAFNVQNSGGTSDIFGGSISSSWSTSVSGSELMLKNYVVNVGSVDVAHWNPSGYLGLGTIVPSEKLEVVGNIKASGVSKIRQFQDGYTNVLTSATGKDFFYVSVPNTNGIGGHVVYTVFATDGTDVQEISGDVKFAAVAKSTTVTASTADVQAPAVVTGGSTLTAALAANVATNNVFALGVTATTSLTTTNLVIKWRVETPSTFTVNAIP